MAEETDTLAERIDRLEAVIEEQQETIERQNERIEELDSDESTTTDNDGITVSRRGALAAGGVLGLLGLGAGTAGATPTGNVGTASRPLETLYTAELDGPLTSSMVNTLAGDGLEIANNALQVDVGDSLSTGDDGSLNAECEWAQDSYEILPADDLVHTVDLDGRRLYDRASEREIYDSTDGLRSDALDIPWVVIAGNQVSLGGSTNIQHNRLLNLAYDNHHGPGDGLAWNSGTGNYDIAPGDFAGSGLGVDADNNLEVTSSGSATWVEGDVSLAPANPGNYTSIDMEANDIIDSVAGATIYDSSQAAVPGGVIADSSITSTQLGNLGSISIDQLTGGVVTDPVTTLDGNHLAVDADTGSLNVDQSTLAGTGLTSDSRTINVDTSAAGGGPVARGKVLVNDDLTTTVVNQVNMESVQVTDDFGAEFTVTLTIETPPENLSTVVTTVATSSVGTIGWGTSHQQPGSTTEIDLFCNQDMVGRGFQFVTYEAPATRQ